MAWYLFSMEKRVLQMAKRFHLRTRSFFMFFSCDFFLEVFLEAAEARCEWESKCLGRDLCRWLISTTYNVFRSLLGCFSPHSKLTSGAGQHITEISHLGLEDGNDLCLFCDDHIPTSHKNTAFHTSCHKKLWHVTEHLENVCCFALQSHCDIFTPFSWLFDTEDTTPTSATQRNERRLLLTTFLCAALATAICFVHFVWANFGT